MSCEKNTGYYSFVMRLGTQIKQLRIAKGLTQMELSEQTGLTERTIQRIENHEVEPSKHSLGKIGDVLGQNLNQTKLQMMTKKQRLLNASLIAISVLIVVEFLIGWLTWEDHWWVLISWFFSGIGGHIHSISQKTEIKVSFF